MKCDIYLREDLSLWKGWGKTKRMLQLKFYLSCGNSIKKRTMILTFKGNVQNDQYI